MKPFEDRQVQAVYDLQPEPCRSMLFELRDMIFGVAESSGADGPQTAPLVESLKWGEASYAPLKARVGSPIRVGRHDEGQVAIYFNCNTTLVEQFRARYGDALRYSGNRAILLDADRPLPEKLVRECVESALTYHWRKRKS